MRTNENELRCYIVVNDGRLAVVCNDLPSAEAVVRARMDVHPLGAPYRIVEMVPAAALAAKDAEVAREREEWRAIVEILIIGACAVAVPNPHELAVLKEAVAAARTFMSSRPTPGAAKEDKSNG